MLLSFGGNLLWSGATDALSRFVSPDVAEKYGLELPVYEGIDQVVEVGHQGEKL